MHSSSTCTLVLQCPFSRFQQWPDIDGYYCKKADGGPYLPHRNTPFHHSALDRETYGRNTMRHEDPFIDREDAGFDHDETAIRHEFLLTRGHEWVARPSADSGKGHSFHAEWNLLITVRLSRGLGQLCRPEYFNPEGAELAFSPRNPQKRTRRRSCPFLWKGRLKSIF